MLCISATYKSQHLTSSCWCYATCPPQMAGMLQQSMCQLQQACPSSCQVLQAVTHKHHGLSSLNISLVCDRSKASVSTGAEALPAEKDIQLGALQDCNTHMLQVTPFTQTWRHCFPVSCSASLTCSRHAMALGSQLIWHCVIQAACLVIVANNL